MKLRLGLKGLLRNSLGRRFAASRLNITLHLELLRNLNAQLRSDREIGLLIWLSSKRFQR